MGCAYFARLHEDFDYGQLAVRGRFLHEGRPGFM
jgi:hypothetical protein